MAVSVDICFTGVIDCCGGSCGKLLLATQAFRVDVYPFEHVHKLVWGRLLGFGVFALAADPSEG